MAYFSMEILPIGESRLRLVRKNVAIKKSFSNNTRPAQLKVHLPKFQIATPLLDNVQVHPINNACRVRPTHGANFSRVPGPGGGMGVYDVRNSKYKDICRREGVYITQPMQDTLKNPRQHEENIGVRMAGSQKPKKKAV